MRILAILVLMSSAFGQVVPAHILATEDLSDPTHPRVFVTFPSTGADEYKVYETVSDNIATGCPAFGSAYVFDSTLPSGAPAISYTDDPNPGLGQVPALKQVGRRGWCYVVTSVLNGVESSPSAPQEVWLGFSAYYAWSYHASCGSPKLPYPFPASAYHPKLWYRDPAGVNHQFAYVDNIVFVDDGGKGQDEIEFHLPTIAMDGTIIPLLDTSKNGKALYFVELTTPDGYESAANIVPYRQGDHVYYNEISTGFVLGDKNYAHNCQGPPSSWWQDVSY